MPQYLRILHRDPAWLAVFISLLLSSLNVINDDTINSDGILYIESARLFLEQGWQATLGHYKWPFYQILIALISKFTFLDLEHAAYVLNAVLLAGLAYAFVRCSEYLHAQKAIIWAAVIILITHLNINGYRDLIIRDFGYWCFFFVAFLMFLKFYAYQKQRYLLLYALSMLLATAFRIEGLVYMLVGPLVLFWTSRSRHTALKNILICWSPLVIIAGLGALFLLVTGNIELGRIADPLRILISALNNITSGIQDKGKILEETVLGIHARNIGTQSFIAILIMMFVTKVFSATGIIPSLLAIRTLTQKNLREQIRFKSVFYWFIFLNIIVLLGFLLAEFFLSGRYVITLVLLLCLLAAVALADIFSSKSPSKKLRFLRVTLVIVLIYLLLDGVTSFSPSKMYRRDAAEWIKNNVPIEQRLISNDELMYYYSSRFVPRQELLKVYERTRFGQVPEINIDNYDVIAIQVGRKQLELKQRIIDWMGKQPEYQTQNSKGAAVLIFKVDK